MLKYFLSLFILIFGLGSIAAQSSINYTLNFQTKFSNNNIFIADTLKILAVMADFKVDKDGTTFGDGTFGSIYSKDYGNSIIDPLPHNKNYFENHLEFVKNYFSQVSKNKLKIKYTVLPNVVTVSKTMRNYAPPRKSDDFSNLANYSQEFWELVSISNPELNFSDYVLFIIFHAGTGNEVTLPGSLGIEKDLPSIFLSNKSLKNIFGQSFKGFALNNSSFKIPNSMIMPETESRENQNIFGTTLVELTFNGLLSANIGSFIGLPDLFNTTRAEIRAEVFRGNESMKALLEEILDYKESYWIGGNSEIENTNLKFWFHHWMQRRVEKKHMLYDLSDFGTNLENLEMKKKKTFANKYYQKKWLPKKMNSPMVIVIFGNKVAQILWSKQSFAFVLESKEIKDSFMNYFNYFWKK